MASTIAAMSARPRLDRSHTTVVRGRPGWAAKEAHRSRVVARRPVGRRAHEQSAGTREMARRLPTLPAQAKAGALKWIPRKTQELHRSLRAALRAVARAAKRPAASRAWRRVRAVLPRRTISDKPRRHTTKAARSRTDRRADMASGPCCSPGASCFVDASASSERRPLLRCRGSSVSDHRDAVDPRPGGNERRPQSSRQGDHVLPRPPTRGGRAGSAPSFRRPHARALSHAWKAAMRLPTVRREMPSSAAISRCDSSSR